MTTNAVTRLAKIEAALRERLAAEQGGPGIVVVIPDETWSAADHAHVAAGGERAADAVERHTGQRPGPRTIVVTLGTRADGPQ